MEEFQQLQFDTASAVIWYSELCSGGYERQYCCHDVIPYNDFCKLENKPTTEIYYSTDKPTPFNNKDTVKEKNEKGIIQNIFIFVNNFYKAHKKESIIGLIVGILALLTALLNFCHSTDSEMIKDPPQPPKIKIDINIVINDTIIHQDTTIINIEHIAGTTKKGDTIDYIAYVFENNYWEFRSDSTFQNGVEKDVEKYFAQNFNQLSNVTNSYAVIAVGTASQEGYQNSEERRADQRADCIIRGIKRTGYPNTIYKLNLGKHYKIKELSKENTYDQRRVIILAVIKSGFNECENEIALKQALETEKNFVFLKNYSLSNGIDLEKQ